MGFLLLLLLPFISHFYFPACFENRACARWQSLIASTNETERNRAMVWVEERCKLLATHNNVFMKSLIMALNSLPCFRSRLFFPLHSFISLTDMLFECMLFRLLLSRLLLTRLCVPFRVDVFRIYFAFYETKTAMKTTFTQSTVGFCRAHSPDIFGVWRDKILKRVLKRED